VNFENYTKPPTSCPEKTRASNDQHDCTRITNSRLDSDDTDPFAEDLSVIRDRSQQKRYWTLRQTPRPFSSFHRSIALSSSPFRFMYSSFSFSCKSLCCPISSMIAASSDRVAIVVLISDGFVVLILQINIITGESAHVLTLF